MNAETLTARLPLELRLRAETEADVPWLTELFIETRSGELAATGWTDAAIREFLQEQFARQSEYYRKVYDGAEYLVIEHGDTPIGRLYLRHASREIRLMDIALLAARRGRGIGTLLIGALIEQARAQQCEITLHVEPNNPAQRMYHRLGFRLIERRGVYDFLGWTDAPNPQEAS